MDHSKIDAENVAERYVTGRLSPEEAAVFEEHYLDCPECCARVEAAQRLDRGMRRLAEEAAADFPHSPRPAQWSRSPRLALAAAALLAVALLPAGFGWWEIRDLRGELGATREALAQAQTERTPPETPENTGRLAALETELQTARRDLAAEAEKREALAREVEAGRRPQVNLPVLPLTPVRGSLEGPPRTLTLPREPGWIALWVEPGDTGFPAYRATLRSARGAEVFQAARLELNDLGALLVTVHSTSLSPGDYRLEIDGLPRAGAPVEVGRFHLRAVTDR